MTVQESVDSQKQKQDPKISRIWICPDQVSEPKIGLNYTYEGSIDFKVPDEVSIRIVTHSWKEDNKLCIIYRADGSPIAFSRF